MFAGDKINATKRLAVLHVALRAPRGAHMEVDGIDVVPDVHAVLDAMAGTDCGDCEYADCDGYTKGIVYEGQTDLNRCAPGGEDTKIKLFQIMLGTKPPSA